MPKKVDHTLRKEAFLKAAHRVIKKRGISGVTARAVAQEAGFTTGALVHYVESVDALLAQASEFSARDVRARMLAAEDLPDRLEALRQVLYLALPSSSDQRGNWNFFLGFWERSVHNAEVRRLTHLRYAEWLKRSARIIRNARDAGMIAKDLDINVAARACVALTDGIAIQVLRSGSAMTTRQQRDMIDDWITLWLRPTQARRKPAAPTKAKRTRTASRKD